MRKIIVLAFTAMLFMTCCKSSKNTANGVQENHDVNTVWVLKTLKNKTMAFGENDRIVTINFNPEARQISGCSGCNTYFGTYNEPKKGKLVFEPIVATKMACPQSMMDTERSYLSTLRKVNGYNITDGLLNLLQDETVVLSFEKQTYTEE
ncbi:MAG: META domain-containing protein [Bacteroidales bacterium]|nr:META domain-containing protein [Bacteroidales bacterium]